MDLKHRYSRHMLVSKIGKQGQDKISQSSVLVVGCGALGSTISQLIVRSGVEKITIMDGDIVELSNLHRQLLYDENDVQNKTFKAKVAAQKLKKINSLVSVEYKAERLTKANAESLIKNVSVVLDGTDNLETRYLINDVCVKLGIPWVYGGAVGTGGLILPIVPGESPCLRCVFPQMPQADLMPSNETVGILGTVPVVVAARQVTAALQLLIGDNSNKGYFTQIDLWNNSYTCIKAQRNDDCPTCVKRNFEFLD